MSNPVAGGGPIVGGRLYGVSLSPFVRKVRAVLSVKGIDYELENVMPGAMSPAFLTKSPLSRIPVWEEGEWSVPDSSVICAYLDRRVPEPPLYPADPKAFARALFWEEYADTRLVETAGPIFFQRIVREHVFKEPADEEIVRRHVEELLPPVFDQLESLFIGRDQASANANSIANISVWAPCLNLEHAGVPIDPDRWPGLAAFYQAVSSQPALAVIVEEERGYLRGG